MEKEKKVSKQQINLHMSIYKTHDLLHMRVYKTHKQL